MYLLNTEATIQWVLAPTGSPPALADLDVLLIDPSGVVDYLTSPILIENYTPPTATVPGSASHPFTPIKEGHWQVSLVIGDPSNYTTLDKVDFYVFDNSVIVPPVKTTAEGVAGSIEVGDESGLRATGITRLDFEGVGFTVAIDQQRATITLIDYPVVPYQSPADLLSALVGGLAETQLTTALTSRIDLIDGIGPGSVNARIADEATRIDTLESTVDNPITGVSANATAVSSQGTWITELEAAMTVQSASKEAFVTRVDNNFAAVETHATSIDGIHAQYTVKVDVNGHVSGFGLASTPINDTPYSVFTVAADAFMIAPPSSVPAGVGTSPFFHYAVETERNGVMIPPGTYIEEAFIVDAAITNAKIANVIESADGGLAWRIDKTGGIFAKSITIQDVNDNLILDSDGNLASSINNADTVWNDVAGTPGAPEDNATNNISWTYAPDPTYIDGNSIYAQTITGNHIQSNTLTSDHIQAHSISADRFISTLEGDLNQALHFTKAILSSGDEYQDTLTQADFDAGSLTTADATTHADYGLSFRIATAVLWTAATETWDNGNSWDTPIESSAIFESASQDFGANKTIQISVEADVFEDNEAHTSVTVEAIYSLDGTNWGTNAGVFNDNNWETCVLRNVSGTRNRWNGNLYTFRYFKFKITLNTTNTSSKVILYNMQFLGNVVNVYESLQNQTIAIGGTTFPLSGYNAPPAITVTANGLIRIPMVSNVSANSFTVTLYSSSGVDQGGTADIIIMGV